MERDDLLRLLDLEGRPPDSETSVFQSSTDEADREPGEVTSPTALAMDEWGLRRGRDLLAESERMRDAGTDEYAAADFHAAAFDPDPQLLPACVEPRRLEFLAQLLDTPEYRSLHASTRLDDVAAGIASVHFAEEFAKLKAEDGADGASSDAVAREMAALRAVGRAVAEAVHAPCRVCRATSRSSRFRSRTEPRTSLWISPASADRSSTAAPMSASRVDSSSARCRSSARPASVIS